MVHDLEFKPDEPLAAPFAGGVPCFPLVVGGSLGSRLLLGVMVGWPNVLIEFVSTGDVEKSSSN